jgi:serine protease inhibitor
LWHDEAVEPKPDYSATAVDVDNTETCTTQDELLAVLAVHSPTSSLSSLVMWRHAPSPTRLGRQAAARSSPLCVACRLWHYETVALKPDYRAAAVEVDNAETRTADFRNKVSSYTYMHML